MSESEIRRLSSERAARVRQRDFEAMAADFYVDDAVLLPSGAEAVSGVHEIRAFWRATPEHGLVSLSLNAQRFEVSGELGYEIGSFNRTLRPRHGAPFQESGKYLVIYRRTEDGWRAAAEMFNSDARR